MTSGIAQALPRRQYARHRPLFGAAVRYRHMKKPPGSAVLTENAEIFGWPTRRLKSTRHAIVSGVACIGITLDI